MTKDGIKMKPGIETVKLWAKKNGIKITPEQERKLIMHRDLVLETNEYMNLTAITDPEMFAVKHIIDSLTLVSHLPEQGTVADIGSGAGFPGMVLAIMRPDLHFTLVDSVKKKAHFLQKAIDALELPNAQSMPLHTVDIIREGITFDVCTARAVSQMSKLVEWALPLLETGGKFLAMKGPDVDEELGYAATVISQYCGIVTKLDVVEIAPGMSHTIITVSKLDEPDYY